MIEYSNLNETFITFAVALVPVVGNYAVRS